MPPLNETFVANVRYRLDSLKIDQRQFAKRLETSDAYVSQLLNGKIMPTLKTVEKVAKSLGCNALFLLTPVASETISKISSKTT